MTITITRNDDVAQEPHVCQDADLTSKLMEVVAPRDSAGVRLAVAELNRKLAQGECYKVEEDFLGVKVDPAAQAGA